MNRPVSSDEKHPCCSSPETSGDLSPRFARKLPRLVTIMFAMDLAFSGWMTLQLGTWTAGAVFLDFDANRGDLWLPLLGLLANLFGLVLAMAADVLGLVWRSRWAVRLGAVAAALALALRVILILHLFSQLASPSNMERFFQEVLIVALLLSVIYNAVWAWAVWSFRQWLDSVETTDNLPAGEETGRD